MRGRRWILAFLATALAGVAVRQLLFRSVTFRAAFLDLLGYETTGPARYGLLFFGPPLATVLVAAVAGYVSPKRFWLWGLAAVCLWPVEKVLQEIYFRYFRYPYLPPDTQEAVGVPDYAYYAGLLFFWFFATMMLAVACVVSASAGAGLRLLVRRLLGGLGATSEVEEPGLSERGGAVGRFAGLAGGP